VLEHAREHEWVRRARTGDRAAFAALVDRYWPRLCRWLHSLTRNKHLAEDLTQEAFFRAWSGLPQLKDDATFRVWLFRIARNCLIDAQRRPGGVAQPLPEDLRDRESGPVTGMLEREADEMLQAALSQLAPLYREPYLLWAQEAFSHSQIAVVLGIPQELVRWRVCKARQLLLAALRTYLDVEKT